MTLPISSDVLVLVLGVVLAALYLFRDQVFSSSTTPKTTTPAVKETNGHGNPRDFVAKMKAGVCRSLIFPSCVLIIML
jgi:NADPH-ferrihemoprotein reductase